MASGRIITTWASYRNLSLGISGQVVKGSPGEVGGWFLQNRSASERFVKLYNKASAPSEADTPVLTLGIPAGEAANILSESGIDFTAGIGLRATTGVADADTGDTSANDVVVNLFYR